MILLKRNLKIALILFLAAKVFTIFAETTSFSEFKTASLKGATGNLNISNGVFTLKSSGSTEGIFFCYVPFIGNGQIITRVRKTSSSAAKVGLLFRQNLQPESLNAGTFLTSSNTVFERRIDLAKISVQTVLTNQVVQWLRIVREGSAFSGFYSDDGTNWTQFSADTIVMPNEIFACLMLGEKGEAVFDQVRMTSAHLIHPLESSSFVAPTNILVEARVGTFATIPRLVEFFSGAEKIGEMTHSPYAIIWSNALAGSRSLTAKITDASGSEFFTEPANCKIKLQPASAKFLGIDDVTKGTWKNKYGIEGFHIIEHATNYPAYAHVSSGRYIRSYPTYTDSPGALQLTNENGRAFAGWLTYGSMDFEIALLDGNAHQIALYCQDWGINLRSQTIDAIDPSTGIVLDSQHAANFATGKYFIWRIQGAVKFRITQLGGSAVLSGIFFDATPP